MQKYLEKTFKDKKILILGFGLEGKSTYKILRQIFPTQPIDIADQNNISEDLGTYTHKYVGGDYLKNVEDFDYIIKSPGVSSFLPEIQKALNSKVKFTSQTRIFFDVCEGKIIGITGTKGKSTTASLTYQILKNGGLNVSLVGNIGKPVLDEIGDNTSDKIYVFELSSHQLYDMEKSPQIAVVTNIGVDHLDWYGSIENYINAKTNILKHQTDQDVAVLNYDNLITREFDRFVKGSLYYVSKDKVVNGAFVNSDNIHLNIENKDILLGSVNELQLLGRHNWDNVMLAAVAAKSLNVDEKTIWEACKNFRQLEHHIEFVKEVKGVKFYNDSFAVDQIATTAAVDSFRENLTLILGGYERGIIYNELSDFIAKKQNVKNIILIGQVAQKLISSLQESGFKGNITNLGMITMDKIIAKSLEVSSSGFVVLFSPAAASFDMFKDYKDRGEQFKKAVADLK